MSDSTAEGPQPSIPWQPAQPVVTPAYTVHGPAPAAPVTTGRIRPRTVEQRIDEWFVKPLTNFEGEDAFVCLMVCLSLMEKWVRYKLRISKQDQDMKFREHSEAIKLLDSFLSLGDEDLTFRFWTNSRNGILHRAMIKKGIHYVLRPDKGGRSPVTIEGGALHICPWIIRDLVLKMLKGMPDDFWTGDSVPLPDIYEASV